MELVASRSVVEAVRNLMDAADPTWIGSDDPQWRAQLVESLETVDHWLHEPPTATKVAIMVDPAVRARLREYLSHDLAGTGIGYSGFILQSLEMWETMDAEIAGWREDVSQPEPFVVIQPRQTLTVESHVRSEEPHGVWEDTETRVMEIQSVSLASREIVAVDSLSMDGDWHTLRITITGKVEPEPMVAQPSQPRRSILDLKETITHVVSGDSDEPIVELWPDDLPATETDGAASDMAFDMWREDRLFGRGLRGRD